MEKTKLPENCNVTRASMIILDYQCKPQKITALFSIKMSDGVIEAPGLFTCVRQMCLKFMAGLN